MGWFGVVFKGEISKISDQLAMGLTTGFLGSLTTFSGWNQKMLELSIEGRWVFAVLGIIIGIELLCLNKVELSTLLHLLVSLLYSVLRSCQH